MYLPRNLQLCRPHVAMWTGESGKRYDFAVCRPGTICVDEPAVYILARHEEQVTTPLFIGHTASLHRRFGLSNERCPEEWRRALAIGMTHVHVRFDTLSKMTREAEVGDLVAALAPVLNDQLKVDDERSSPAVESAQSAAAPTGQARVYRRERWAAGGEARPPALAMIDVGRQSFARRGFAPPLFRADPAREDDGGPDDFETPVVAVDTPDAQLRPGVRPVETTFEELDQEVFEEFEQEVEVVQLAPAEPPAMPDVQRRQDEQLTAAPSAEVADAVQVEASAEPAKPTGFLARLCEFVERLRTPRRPDTLADAGSVVSRVLAPVPGVSAALPAMAGATERYTGSEEAWGAARDSTTPVRHGHLRGAKPAEAPKDASPPEPLVAIEASQVASPAEPVVEASQDTCPAEPVVEASQVASPAEPVVEASQVASPAEPVAEASQVTSPADPITAKALGQQEAKRGLGLDPSAPVVLFAGKLSYDAGADILLDAIITVAGDNQEAQFLFAGDGAIRGELQERAARAGLDRRCRFLGHVPAESFHRVLTACDFVVIPARVRQDEALARLAIAAGKPVATTHQAAISFIVHGLNGLITYDNPGSFVWAVRTLLGPLHASLRRHLAEPA